MDHSEVVRLQAVEKYVLGELPAELRDEFEEHYFDCAECAADVKHLATFVTASRMILEEPPKAKKVAAVKQPEKASWFAWLRPAIAVPAVVALAAVVIFQNVSTIPSLKRTAGQETRAPVFSSTYHLQGATRGENSATVTIGADESFALDFDFTPATAYPRYIGRLVDSKGSTALSFTVKGELANTELHVAVPGGRVQPGEYELVITGEGGSSAGSGSPDVQRIPFTVTYRQ